MDFSLTDEQRMLEETVDHLMRDTYTFEQRQRYRGEPLGFSLEVWRNFSEMGLLALLHNENHGGFNGAGPELMVVCEGFGRHLVVEPYLATVVLAGSVIQTLGNRQQTAHWLQRIALGETRFSLALYEPDGFYDASHINTRVEKTAAGYRLNGRKAVVLQADSADYFVVVARSWREADGLSAFIVAANSEGVKRRGYATIDGQRGAEIVLDNVEVDNDALLGKLGEAWAGIDRALSLGCVALCAEAVGAMTSACEQTLNYLHDRKQFGVSIGKFQVLQHRMVNMHMALEKARSLTLLAACSLTEKVELRDKRLHAAKIVVGKAGRQIAEDAIHLHGGMGMMEETPISHYAKRLIMIDHLLGDTHYHLQQLVPLQHVMAEIR